MDFYVSMAISVILNVIKQAVTSKPKKAALKNALLKVRDNINLLYPED